MPIKFRCPNCRQFLGISPTRAGELTDCPACGRTVRVPNLDGTIAPLPSARIDHRDSQLAEALSALSQIGAPVERPAELVIPRATPAPIASAAPTAVAVPTADPLPAERILTEPAFPQPAADAIPTLLFDADVEEVEPVRARRRRPIPIELRILAVALATMAVFLAGFLTGRSVERSKGTAPPVSPPAVAPTKKVVNVVASPEVVPVEHEEQVPPTSGVSGRLTYPMGSGASRPDEGARVIALPASLPATPSLPVAGFRPVADAAARERAVLLIRETGGDFAIADADGHFTLQLPAGRFEVLFLSRHVPRDETQPVASQIGSLISAYFDQPAALAGSVRVDATTLDFDGVAQRLDHAFPP